MAIHLIPGGTSMVLKSMPSSCVLRVMNHGCLLPRDVDCQPRIRMHTTRVSDLNLSGGRHEILGFCNHLQATTVRSAICSDKRRTISEDSTSSKLVDGFRISGHLLALCSVHTLVGPKINLILVKLSYFQPHHHHPHSCPVLRCVSKSGPHNLSTQARPSANGVEDVSDYGFDKRSKPSRAASQLNHELLKRNNSVALSRSCGPSFPSQFHEGSGLHQTWLLTRLTARYRSPCLSPVSHIKNNQSQPKQRSPACILPLEVWSELLTRDLQREYLGHNHPSFRNSTKFLTLEMRFVSSLQPLQPFLFAISHPFRIQHAPPMGPVTNGKRADSSTYILQLQSLSMSIWSPIGM